MQNSKRINQKQLTSINLLEYVTIIILYAAATQYVHEYKTNVGHGYPTINVLSDNTSAVVWTRKAAISTEAGKALARLLCFQMINNKLVLHAHHVPGVEIERADTISRLNSTTQQELFTKYPSLRTYKQYLFY